MNSSSLSVGDICVIMPKQGACGFQTAIFLGVKHGNSSFDSRHGLWIDMFVEGEVKTINRLDYSFSSLDDC